MADIDAAHLLRPDFARLEQLLARVTTSLRPVAGVWQIAIFGSRAEDRADCWSDIDMIVGCEHRDAAQWSAAAAIRAAQAVLFYQVFSLADQPSGRYWFADESPFHKLDVSFVPLAEYRRLMQEGTSNGHPITLREIHAVTSPMPGAVPPPVAPNIIHFSEAETRIRQCHVPLMNSLRSRLRGRDMYPNSSAELAEKAAELRRRLDGITPRTTMAGGRIGLLAWQLVEMAEYLLRCV